MRRLLGLLGMGLLCAGCGGSNDTVQGSGGASGSGGSGGFDGRAQPTTSNVFVDQIMQTQVDKVDLLLMIDNSPSMGDKQALLKAAVPALFKRLISPRCLDRNGKPTGVSATDGVCASGRGTPEFAPVTDIHLGIVSSSLGAHGGTVCSDAKGHLDDHAHLIGSLRSGLDSWNDSGFLAWDPARRSTPAGQGDPKQFVTDFAAMVDATGEDGCGYEASLESWYRFLIDPEPPKQVTKSGGETKRAGIDSELLAQRAAFLRPDSAVVIAILSDENDCSIRDEGLGWMVASSVNLPKSTEVCGINPNDPCCRSCSVNEAQPPSGCLALADDGACKGSGTWDALHDSPSLRCFSQRQRFGIDLLYPTERYVDGLRKATLTLPSDPTRVVVNPLFDGRDGKPGRDPSLVFLAGIVGVPWQDIATDASLSSPSSLEFLSASELEWSWLVGDPAAQSPKPPADPFMVETTDERHGANPSINAQTAPANSTKPTASVINGHEHSIPNLDDLQYACTFPLAEPRDCAAGDPTCDCAPAQDGSTAALEASNNPLCQPPSGGAAGKTQYFAKAYPGTRELQVLKGVGSNAIVASICPKVVTSADPSADPNYGYNPALQAIGDRLKDALAMKCLPRAISTKPDKGGSEYPVIDGCSIVEAKLATEACDCTVPGRSEVSPTLIAPVVKQIRVSGACGAPGQPTCEASNYCVCQINQETGADLNACVLDQPVASPGFCYIDEPTSPALQQCPPNAQRRLRFVAEDSEKIPADGALLFVACEGASVTD